MSTFFRLTKCPWFVIPAIAGVFVLVWTALMGYGSPEEPTLPPKQLEEVLLSLQRVERELFNHRQGIPKETEQKLKEMEALLENPKQWPVDQNQAEKMRQGLKDIVQNLSPFAAEKILPQLARLNWGVEALWNLRNHANAEDNQLDEVEATIKEVLESQPRGYFMDIQLVLEARLGQVQPQSRAFQLKQLLDRANRSLLDKKDKEDKEDASSVYTSLEEFRKEKGVPEILAKLRARVIEEQLEGLQKKLNKTQKLVDERVRQVSLLTIQESVFRLVVDLELQVGGESLQDALKKAKDLLAQCDKELLSLADRNQLENAKKIRRYQAWALKQIRAFDSPQGCYFDESISKFKEKVNSFENSVVGMDFEIVVEFPSIKDLIKEKLQVDLSDMKDARLIVQKQKDIFIAARPEGPTGRWANNIADEVAYRVTRDGIVKYLLPIQPNLLDPPVALLYQAALAKGWNKLERREDQLFVAEQSAIVQKMTVEAAEVQKRTVEDVPALKP